MSRRLDPTGLADVRAKMRAETDRRWTALRRHVRRAIVGRDALAVAATAPALARPTAEKAQAFHGWLSEQMASRVGAAWMDPHLAVAAGRAASRVGRLVGVASSAPSSLPVCRAATALHAGRIQEDAAREAHTAVAAQLLAHPQSRKLARVADTPLARAHRRARVLAEHAATQAYTQASLDAYEAAGISKVGSVAEHSADVADPVVRRAAHAEHLAGLNDAVRAAGILHIDPEGNGLFLHRTDGEGWALPGGGLEPGEDPEHAAVRETLEECGGAPTSGPLSILTVSSGPVEFHTFRRDVPQRFEPSLNHEHDAAVWAPLSSPPEPLHPGVAWTLRSAGLMDGFDPDEPRDEAGRWTASGIDPEKAKAAGYSLEQTGNVHQVIKADGKRGKVQSSGSTPAKAIETFKSMNPGAVEMLKAEPTFSLPSGMTLERTKYAAWIKGPDGNILGGGPSPKHALAVAQSQHPELFGLSTVPTGEWYVGTDEKVWAYHGTSEDVVADIMREGIRVNVTKSFDEDYYEGERGQSVYVSNSEEGARIYAGSRGGTGVVLEVHIPKDEWKKFKRDEKFGVGGTSAARAVLTIPPAWIKRATDDMGDPFPLSDAEQDFVRKFLVVFADGGVRDAGWWSEEPRDDHGKWTSGGSADDQAAWYAKLGFGGGKKAGKSFAEWHAPIKGSAPAPGSPVHAPKGPPPWEYPETARATVQKGIMAAAEANAGATSWPPPDREDWAAVPGKALLEEPPLERDEYIQKDGTPSGVPDKHQRLASGVIIREPDGKVWLVHPKSAFGGYRATFPKGGLEEGLSPQANAIKEAYEETGLKVKIVGLLGDFRRTTSKTRYYEAVREGGNTDDRGWETHHLSLVDPADLHIVADNKTDAPVIAAIRGIKDAFDPDEPRDDQGQWTETGRATVNGKSIHVVTASEASPFLNKTFTHEPTGTTAEIVSAGTNSAPSQEAATRVMGTLPSGKQIVSGPERRQVSIKWVETPPQSRLKGGGHAVMNQVTEHLDKYGLPAVLNTTAELHGFYASHGFVPVKNRDGTVNQFEMIREPKQSVKDAPSDPWWRSLHSGKFVSKAHRSALDPDTEWEGPEEEDVQVQTAEDALVCQTCEDIAANGPYDIATARDLIPAHIHCRCVFVPA